MGFAAPHWLWLLLLAIPIVALYTRRPHRPTVRVSSLALWTAVDGRARTPGRRLLGRLDERLLALALFLLALLGSVLGLARPGTRSPAPRDVVVVIEAGAAMAVRDGTPPRARLERAEEALAALEASLGPGDGSGEGGGSRRWVIAAGVTPRVIAGPGEPLPGGGLGLALEGGGVDLEAALELARGVLGARGDGEGAGSQDGAGGGSASDGVRREVWLLAAERLPIAGRADWPEDVELRQVSAAASPAARDDVALGGSLRRLDAEHVRLQLAVTNHGRIAAAVLLEARLDGQAVVREAPRPIAPGETRTFPPRDLACARGGVVEARLVQATPGGQPLDDALAWVVPAPERLRVTLHDPRGDRFVRAALAADLQVDRRDDEELETADLLVVTDAEGLAPRSGAAWRGAVWIGPAALAASAGTAELDLPLEAGAAREVGPASLRLEPLAPSSVGEEPVGPDLAGLDLEERVVLGAVRVRPGPGWRTLVRAGDGPDAPPLVMARAERGRREVALTFDPGRSDLVLGRAFPLLLARALRWVGARGDPEPRWTRVGEVARVHASRAHRADAAISGAESAAVPAAMTGAAAATPAADSGGSPPPATARPGPLGTPPSGVGRDGTALATAFAPDGLEVPVAPLDATGHAFALSLTNGPGVYEVRLPGGERVAVAARAGSTPSGPDGATRSGRDDATGSGRDGAPGSGADGAPGSGRDGATGSGRDGAPGSGADGAPGSGRDGATGSGRDGATGSGPDGATGSGSDEVTDSATDGATAGAVVVADLPRAPARSRDLARAFVLLAVLALALEAALFHLRGLP